MEKRTGLAAMVGAVLAATVLTACEPAPPPSWDPSILELSPAGVDSGASEVVVGGGVLVAFVTWRGLVPEDTNGWEDLYVHDLMNGDTVLITRNLDGGTSSEPGYPSLPTFSVDGSKLAFSSSAQDLVPEPTGGRSNVFVFDMMTRTTTLASVNAAGTAGGAGDSRAPVLSPDGSKVVFSSDAVDLGPRVHGIYHDLFVRDLVTGTTSLVTVRNDGEPGYGGVSGPAWFTPNGTTVVFSTSADLTGTNTQYPQLYSRDLGAGTTALLSRNAAGEPADYGAGTSVLSRDGTKVAFTSAATNLAPGDTNDDADVFLHDLETGAVTLVSSDAAGTGSGNRRSSGPVFSQDGTRIAFTSFATNLGPADDNTLTDVYLRDLRTGTSSLVSVDSSGRAAGGESPAFDYSDTRLAFVSRSGDFGPADTNRLDDVYVRDLSHGVTSLVSANADGTDSGDAWSTAPAFTYDGAVVFSSAARDLDPRQTADSHDVFVASPPATADAWVDATVAAAPGDGGGAHVTVTVGNNGPDAATGVALAVVLPAGMTPVSVTSSLGSCDIRAGGPPAVVSCELEAVDKWASTEVEITATVDEPGGSYTVTAAVRGDTYDPEPPNNVDSPVLLPPEPPDPPAPTGTIRQLTTGADGPADGDSHGPVVSADGRYVAFTSTASDLVPGDDANIVDDVFLWDRATGSTTQITDGNSRSHSPSISADGSHIAFTSAASDLTPGDDNGRSDVFLWDRATGGITRLTDGDDNSWWPRIAADGSRVGFASMATDLVPGDTNGAQDAYVWDAADGTITRVSNGTGASNPYDISGDGRRIAYSSFTSNEVSGDDNERWDVFVWDSETGATTRLGGTGGDTLGGELSDDGRYVVVSSTATDLVPGDTDGSGLFVWDATTQSFTRISTGGQEATISGDGRFVAYIRHGEVALDVHLWDATTGIATKLTDGIDDSANPSISADGTAIAFSSEAYDLVPGGFDRVRDIFLWDRETSGAEAVGGGG